MSKLVKWGLIAFVIFYIANDPTGAAGFAHSLLNGLHTAATSMSTFVSSL
jgi:hypothetical protein